MTTVFIVVGLMAFLLALAVAGRRWLKWRGARLITCPESHRPAAVQLDAARVALQGQSALRLKECSRWPEKQSCGQECLHKIQDSPEGCLVRRILAQWYADKSCAYCGSPLGQIDWHERKPALLGPHGATVEWHEIRPEQVPETLASHRAVCWNCHIVERFRRQHPDLVVERSR